MGGDTGFRHRVHVLGPDLHFDGRAVGPEQNGVQRLIAVGLGQRHVVFELAGDGLIQPVHDTERAVAGVGGFDGNSKGVNVLYFGERQPLAAHFAIEAVKVLFPSLDAGGQILLPQAALHRSLDFSNHLLAMTARFLHLR